METRYVSAVVVFFLSFFCAPDDNSKITADHHWGTTQPIESDAYHPQTAPSPSYYILSIPFLHFLSSTAFIDKCAASSARRLSGSAWPVKGRLIFYLSISLRLDANFRSDRLKPSFWGRCRPCRPSIYCHSYSDRFFIDLSPPYPRAPLSLLFSNALHFFTGVHEQASSFRTGGTGQPNVRNSRTLPVFFCTMIQNKA
jgi:hypothetical protein